MYQSTKKHIINWIKGTIKSDQECVYKTCANQSKSVLILDYLIDYVQRSRWLVKELGDGTSTWYTLFVSNLRFEKPVTE